MPGSGLLQILVLSIYACIVGHKLLNAAQTAPIRSTIWTLFSVVFFAQLFLGMAGMQFMLMTGELHAPVPALILAGPVYRGHGLFMPILYSITVLLVGPAWCSYLCYIGAWDDITSRWNTNKPHPIPKWATHTLRALLAMLIVGTAWLLRISNNRPPAAALNPEQARTAFIVLIVSIHTLFLGVARI